MAVTLLLGQWQNYRRVAVLKNGNLTDMDIEAGSLTAPSYSSVDVCLDAPLGQIYWGRVVSVAATHVFVNLAPNNLPSNSLIGLMAPEAPFPKPHEGQAVLVQVRREAMPDKGSLHKGPLLTRKITLGGRYCLFHPFQEKRVMSSRIREADAIGRLERLVAPQSPYTLRASCAAAPEENILAEMELLRQKFAAIQSLAENTPCPTPYDALPPSHRWMRDLDITDTEGIFMDDNATYRDCHSFLARENPALLPALKKHHRSTFEDYGLEDVWDTLFENVVSLSGQEETGATARTGRGSGNIVIDVTAAAIVIDVNTGSSPAFETSKAAIPAIVQQLKWRCLGGNIIIDFAGPLVNPHHKSALKDLLASCCTLYNLPLSFMGWSKSGWMEARLPKRRLSLPERARILSDIKQ